MTINLVVSLIIVVVSISRPEISAELLITSDAAAALAVKYDICISSCSLSKYATFNIMRLSKYLPFKPNSVDEIVSGAYGVAAANGFELSALKPPALNPSATLK